MNADKLILCVLGKNITYKEINSYNICILSCTLLYVYQISLGANHYPDIPTFEIKILGIAKFLTDKICRSI